MSRLYEMSICVEGHNPDCAEKIKDAINDHWLIEHMDEYSLNSGPEIHASGTSSLCGGESEEEFAERLSIDVWRANDGNYCDVTVKAVYLEDLPNTIHKLDEGTYEEYKAEGRLDKETDE